MFQRTLQSANWRFLVPVVLVLAAVMLIAATCYESPSRSSGDRWAIVTQCVPPVGPCLPYPQEWGAWYESDASHIHNVESPSNYYRNLHMWKQVMWFGGTRDSNGNYMLPYGFLYSMYSPLHSISLGDLGNIPIGDGACGGTLAPGDTLILGCFDGAPINLGRPGGHANFHAGWAATGTVIPPSNDAVDYRQDLHHRHCHARCSGG